MLRAAPTLRAPIPLQRAAMRTPHAAARPVQRTPNAGKPGLPVCAILPGTPRAAVALPLQGATIQTGQAARRATAGEQKK